MCFLSWVLLLSWEVLRVLVCVMGFVVESGCALCFGVWEGCFVLCWDWVEMLGGLRNGVKA